MCIYMYALTSFILSLAQNLTPYCKTDAHAYLDFTGSIDQPQEEKKNLNSPENVRFLLSERAAKFVSISARPSVRSAQARRQTDHQQKHLSLCSTCTRCHFVITSRRMNIVAGQYGGKIDSAFYLFASLANSGLSGRKMVATLSAELLQIPLIYSGRTD